MVVGIFKKAATLNIETHTEKNQIPNNDKLSFPVSLDLKRDYVELKLEDESYVRMDYHHRSLERNVLSSYGVHTDQRVFFFTGLETFRRGEGRAHFLMSCSCEVLDQANFWVFNEVRPSEFSDENLNRLIRFYTKYGFELLEKGKDAALMYRRPIR